MQIRTINEAIKILKEEDPNTELSYASVRNMIQSEVLPAMKSGNKYLIDVDVLRSMFGAATPTEEVEKNSYFSFSEEEWNQAIVRARKNEVHMKKDLKILKLPFTKKEYSNICFEARAEGITVEDYIDSATVMLRDGMTFYRVTAAVVTALAAIAIVLLVRML